MKTEERHGIPTVEVADGGTDSLKHVDWRSRLVWNSLGLLDALRGITTSYHESSINQLTHCCKIATSFED